jgi:hypothetical protein
MFAVLPSMNPSYVCLICCFTIHCMLQPPSKQHARQVRHMLAAWVERFTTVTRHHCHQPVTR